MKRIVEFLKKIKEEEKVFVVFHNDADGVCAAAIISKYLKKKKVFPELVSQPIPPKKATFYRISWEKPDKVVILDIDMAQAKELLERFNCGVAIIDHHVSEDLSSAKVVHYNPRFEKPDAYLPASFLVYKICKKLGLDEKWVAFIGILGDVADERLLPIKNKDKLEEIKNIIASVKAIEGRRGCEIFANLLSETSKPDELFLGRGQRFLRDHLIIQEEIERIKRDFERRNEVVGKVVFYELRSKYKIRSTIATILFKDKTLGIFDRENDDYIFSFRAKDVDLTKVIKNVLKVTGGVGGGHPEAAGATIPFRKINDFKSLFAKEVNASLQL